MSRAHDRSGSASLARRGGPLYFLVIAAGAVFAVEIVVMLLLPWLPPFSPSATALLDAALLTLLLSPVLYGILFRPLARELRERRLAEEAGRSLLRQAAHSERLLVALSQAAQAVQRARTPEEVHRAVGDEVVRLGHHAMVFTLAADREHLELSHLTFESALLRSAEKLVGVSAQGYRFPLAPGGFYQRILAEQRSVFSARIVDHLAEVLPGPARPLVSRIAALLGLEQSILAPLEIGGEIRGLLAVAGTGLTEADLPAVTTFANQTSIALENVRMYQDARQQSERLAALNEIARAAASSLEIETAFPLITGGLERLLHFDRASLALLDGAGETMTAFVLRTETAPSELERTVQVPVAPFVLEVRRTSRGIVRQGLAESDHPFDRALVREGIRCALAAPLLSRGQVIGTCNLGSREPEAYGEEQLSLLQAVANQIAPVLENTRLLAAVRESEARYRALFGQAAASIAVTDPETGRFVDFNDSAHENLGYTREEFAELAIADIEVVQPAEDVAQHIEKVLRGEVDVFETQYRRKDGGVQNVLVSAKVVAIGGKPSIQGMWQDISQQKRLVRELEDALAKVRTLRGLLPICAHCKKIRDDKGYWSQIESYIHLHSDAEFSHGICPECLQEHFPDLSNEETEAPE